MWRLATSTVAQTGDDARRERNHRLVVREELVDLRGLACFDRGVLMGGLIKLAEIIAGADGVKVQFVSKASGDALLAEREKILA